ncbi:MAG: hypothetical protein IKE18_04675 [Oscillospiraceae bacterium]|nr:hypothetical protein [Oscillospiraceae bacterium]
MGNSILFPYDDDHRIQEKIVQPAYIVLIAFVVISAGILMLSFVGPEHSESAFWKTIHSVRKGMDLISYWFFNAMAALTVGIAIYILILKVQGKA